MLATFERQFTILVFELTNVMIYENYLKIMLCIIYLPFVGKGLKGICSLALVTGNVSDDLLFLLKLFFFCLLPKM